MSERDIWETLANRGVIAELKIGRPRFEERLSLSDLGIKPRNKAEADSLESQVRAGTKLLLPPRYDRRFKSLESAARHTLQRNTEDPGQGFIFAFDTPLGAFIPVSAFEPWLDRVKKYRADYKALSKELRYDYTKVKGEVVREYVNIAEGTWRRLKAASADSIPTQEVFTRAYVHAVRRAFPNQEELAWCEDHATHLGQHTYFEWRLRHIAMPDDMRKAVVAEQVATEEERARKKTLLQMAEMARESGLRELEGFGVGLNKQLYTLLFEVCERATESINNASHMPSKTLEMLQGLVNQVQALNVMDNAEIAKWASQLAQGAGAYSAASRRERTETGAESLLTTLDVIRTASNARLEKYGEGRRIRRYEDTETRVRVEDAPRRQRSVA